MGIDIHSARLLAIAKKRGVNFGRVLMLGHQDMNVSAPALARILSDAGCTLPMDSTATTWTGFADPLFAALGATEIRSLDASSYQQATVQHDLNQPIPESWRMKYDVVYDGGTLEHVFNFPTALRNAMDMVRIGGRLFLDQGINNWCGHGFYQFSPELFFRVFCAENGYELERVVVHSVNPFARWYEVTDPAILRSRIELLSWLPLMIFVQARRIAATPVLERMPQQSDYATAWSTTGNQTPGAIKRFQWLEWCRPLATLARALHTMWRLTRTHSFANRAAFRPVSKR
ncbi:MAG: hypothetical protein EPN23_03050 [Verrucomicrobia bacterium]|nr:MAG: hypothetical protein EPN23_03050 [Verrucomicrobiota bacterium]